MKIMQSTIERLLYILLMFMFIATIAVGIIAYQDGKKINSGVKAIEQQQNCLATYFTIPHRTGDTTINCEGK